MSSAAFYSAFIKSLEGAAPAPNLTAALKALWWDGKGDWKRAHDILQEDGDESQSHVHAYLHRKEGEDWNARYWYAQAGEPYYNGTLESEWQTLVERYLKA